MPAKGAERRSRAGALLLPPLLFASACAGQADGPLNLVPGPVYEAHGSEPFWSLTIGGDRIVLSTGQEELGELVWSRTLPRTVNGVRMWQAGEGERAVSIEARPAPCATEAQEIYADEVVVRYAGIEFTGCGGRLIGREDD